MGLLAPHDMGIEFIPFLLVDSCWRLAHARARNGLIKAHAGAVGTMACASREIQLHQQVKM